MIGFSHTGNFKKTRDFLNADHNSKVDSVINSLASTGVSLLQANTPRKTGKTAASWRYEIEKSEGQTSVNFINDNVVNYVNIAIILQYGHATKNGGYVEGRDYINPALQPIFDLMADRMWEAVVSK